jgi:hypothetical protein
MTTPEIEIAVSDFFGVSRYMIVPNVWWGLGLNHECDIFAVSKTGYVSEVEIKINRYDLKRDRKKPHAHGSKLIRRLFFAIPESLIPFIGYIQKEAGVIVVNETEWAGTCRLMRPATMNKLARPLKSEEIQHLGRLASMRIWGLKKSISNHNENRIVLTWDYED